MAIREGRLCHEHIGHHGRQADVWKAKAARLHCPLRRSCVGMRVRFERRPVWLGDLCGT